MGSRVSHAALTLAVAYTARYLNIPADSMGPSLPPSDTTWHGMARNQATISDHGKLIVNRKTMTDAPKKRFETK